MSNEDVMLHLNSFKRQKEERTDIGVDRQSFTSPSISDNIQWVRGPKSQWTDTTL